MSLHSRGRCSPRPLAQLPAPPAHASSRWEHASRSNGLKLSEETGPDRDFLSGPVLLVGRSKKKRMEPLRPHPLVYLRQNQRRRLCLALLKFAARCGYVNIIAAASVNFIRRFARVLLTRSIAGSMLRSSGRTWPGAKCLACYPASVRPLVEVEATRKGPEPR